MSFPFIYPEKIRYLWGTAILVKEDIINGNPIIFQRDLFYGDVGEFLKY
jgi:hypothetical protein